MRNASSSPATNTPRVPNAAELEQLSGWLRELGHDADEAASTAANAYVAVYDDYMTGSPGYCGKLMSVVWDGSPTFFEVFTWENGKIVREDRDYDEKECVGCGAKNSTFCFNCWRQSRADTSSATASEGPWHIETLPNGMYMVRDSAQLVATISVLRENNPRKEQANARLIAAAPDLLEAAKQAMADMEQSRGDSPHWGNLSRAASRLGDAIAKATGSDQ